MLATEDQLRGLMVNGLDGNAADHAALLRMLVPLLRKFYRSCARGVENDLEDLVQDTLIAVHTRRVTYDRDRRFTTWLFAVARHKMIDHYRRERRAPPLDEASDALLVNGFESALGARLDVRDLLETLPAKQARLIRATRIDGLSVAEAAAVHEVSVSDVKVSVHRGLKSMKARVGGDEA